MSDQDYTILLWMAGDYIDIVNTAILTIMASWGLIETASNIYDKVMKYIDFKTDRAFWEDVLSH